MIRLRRFNQTGVERYQEYVHRIREGENAPIARAALDEDLTEFLSVRPILDVRGFNNRWELAKYLEETLQKADLDFDIAYDIGLWCWLSAVWMDEIAPLVDGRRNLKETARWIPQFGNYRRYYRHLLAGPYLIYHTHREEPACTLALLATPVDQPGEVAGQFAAYQQIVTSSCLLEAIRRLYFDTESGRLKTGAASKGSGGARRLAGDIIPQLDLTWDFYDMDPDQILDLLPEEFDKFKVA